MHILPYQILDSCYFLRRSKASGFMQLDMVRWFGVVGAELCLVVLWTSIEDYACITSHAPITPVAHFIFAVKSGVVYFILVCWALLLQSFGAAQIHHTRRPTEFCFHGYVQVKAIAILLCATNLDCVKLLPLRRRF